MAPITFAHRGGGADAPENTLAAFRRALELGATGLESDARLSGDGEVVLVHDAVIRRGLRRIRVDATPAADLSEMGVPRLADLYAEVGTRFDLSIDLKVPGAAGSILHVARTAGDPSALWLCSRDADLLRRLRSEDPDVRLVQSLGRRRGGGGLERLAAGLARDGIRALNLHESDCSLGVVSLVHRFGLLAFAWDAQEARRIRAVLGMGVDGIYSDHVERMVATVGEWSVGPG